MGVGAVLRVAAVTVDPGSDARCHVLIRNNGAVVDQFRFAVLGEAHDWTAVKPERANLMPAQEVTVELTFSPPRGHEVLTGEYPFAVQVASREDPGGSVVQEGLVTVTEYAELSAELVPVNSSGARKGKHTLAVDNLGNVEHSIDVRAADPDDKLTFTGRPKVPVLRPGTTTFVKLRARPRKYFWRGADRAWPFTVTVLSELTDPIDLNATFQQRPMLPRRTFLIFSLLIMALMVIALLLSTLLRAAPKTMAGPSPSIPPTSSSASTSVSSTGATSSASSSAPSITPAAPTPTAAGVGGQPPPVRLTPAATSTRLTVTGTAYPGVSGPQLFSYVVPNGRTYRLITLELANPGGDQGSARISLDSTQLAAYDLATVRQTSRALTGPVTATGGQVITMAVTCTNADRPCTPTTTITAQPIT
ncbi:hypothetical protein [Amycolatopsis sp. WQ 127309]|uniref:COG1470 family protein n=1 Tax=Amycolatopsis sp. WQ 127309 TaxID=2932773 RepID=UPI001FF22F0C|nr:hypothetical protein [Amycolatopsis sp. WQ 127309]UOZ05631.1 hypothetical protein MUY22_43535 [Amycolatopsis sp. WQ 127309]